MATPTGKPTGRPPKRSEETDAIIFQRLQGFGCKLQAAKSAGIARSTLYRWMSEDAEFSDRCNREEAKFTAFHLGKMVAASIAGDLKATEFLLKHLSPSFRPRRPSDPASDLLDLPKTVDAKGCLESMDIVIQALSKGEISTHGAQVFKDLIDSQRKIMDEELRAEVDELRELIVAAGMGP
jgi:hypothetical protein